MGLTSTSVGSRNCSQHIRWATQETEIEGSGHAPHLSRFATGTFASQKVVDLRTGLLEVGLSDMQRPCCLKVTSLLELSIWRAALKGEQSNKGCVFRCVKFHKTASAEQFPECLCSLKVSNVVSFVGRRCGGRSVPSW